MLVFVSKFYPIFKRTVYILGGKEKCLFFKDSAKTVIKNVSMFYLGLTKYTTKVGLKWEFLSDKNYYAISNYIILLTYYYLFY